MKRPAVACGDGRARAVPTVLWLANLEVPDPEWRNRGGGGEVGQPYSALTRPYSFWQRSHVLVIFILK